MRPFVQQLLNKEDLIGVEVGVFRGEFSQVLLDNLSIHKLYLVDPWRSYRGYTLMPRHHKRLFRSVRKHFRNYENVQILRMQSSQAAEAVNDELDFVYIDGNHKYEYVKQDIACWRPKIKKGGLLGGHDYCSRYPGVMRAVNELEGVVRKPSDLRDKPKDRDWFTIVGSVIDSSA